MPFSIQRLKKSAGFAWTTKFFRAYPRGEVYLVGGSVRDILLGRLSKDFDFVVRGVAIRTLEKFLRAHGTVHLVGKQFGVFKFVPRGADKSVDIALPRRDYAFGTGGYRDFKIQSNYKLAIEEDLSRRDFTVNAMAVNVHTGEIIDPFGGEEDLDRRLIRAVGNPRERFSEDYSRMLRALRFAVQLGFKIEKKTWLALKKNMVKINAQSVSKKHRAKNNIKNSRQPARRLVPYEVVSREFLKSLVANAPAAIDLWERSGALARILPEVKKMQACGQSPNYHSEGNVWAHTKLAIQKTQSRAFKNFFSEPISGQAIIALLLHDVGKPQTRVRITDLRAPGGFRTTFYGHPHLGAELAGNIVRRLALSSTEEVPVDADAVSWIVRYHLLPHTDALQMTPAKLEKYFFGPWGRELMQVALADALATIPSDGKPHIEGFRKLIKKLATYKPRNSARPALPILSGREIMKALHLTPGPEIGRIKEALRNEQLRRTQYGQVMTKKQAIAFIGRVQV